jgi:hypothetical protein
MVKNVSKSITKLFVGLLLIAGSIAITMTSCTKSSVEPVASTNVATAEEASSASGEIIIASDRAACGYTTISNDGCSNSTNNYSCVLYARCKVGTLPYGLNTYAQKVAIINSYVAAAGNVAVINVGNAVGHVAYVKSVSGTTITIRESNWCSGKITERSGTKSALSITGYFKP